jgi:hypothetical protein
MRSSDVLERAKAKLAELGVPKHIHSVRKVPSKVRVCLLLRGSAWTLDLRKGITSTELEHKLSHLAAVWEHAQPTEQVDLEDAIKARR